MAAATKIAHVIEPFSTGHRPLYARRVIDVLSRVPGVDVALHTLPDSVAVLGSGLRLAAVHTIDPRLRARSDRYAPRPFAGWTLLHFHWRALARQHDDSLVFMPYADYCLIASGVLGSPFGTTRWSGITMRPSFHHLAMGIQRPPSNKDVVEKQLFLRALRAPSLVKLFTIDRFLYGYLSQRLPVDARKLEVIEDPCRVEERSVTPAESRRVLGLPNDRRILLLYGSVSPRKGLAALLDGCARDDWPEDAMAVVAGALTQEARPILEAFMTKPRVSDRVLLIDRYFSDEDECHAYNAADAVWLRYEHFYQPSGVFSQATSVGLPIVATRDGVIGKLAADYANSVFCDDYTSASVAAAVRLALSKRRCATINRSLTEGFDGKISDVVARAT